MSEEIRDLCPLCLQNIETDKSLIEERLRRYSLSVILEYQKTEEKLFKAIESDFIKDMLGEQSDKPLGNIMDEPFRAEIQKMEFFHPRAVKLLRKQKPFLVIAFDEPYYLKAYDLIREEENRKKTWTDEDEYNYQEWKLIVSKGNER